MSILASGIFCHAGNRDYDRDAFMATNEAILNDTGSPVSGTQQRITASVAWDGQSRGQDNITKHVLHELMRRGVQAYRVSAF